MEYAASPTPATTAEKAKRQRDALGDRAHERRYAELELELILSHMTQKAMLRGEVGARALRVRSDVRGHGKARLCKALGCGK